MTGSPPTADIRQRVHHFRLVPKPAVADPQLEDANRSELSGSASKMIWAAADRLSSRKAEIIVGVGELNADGPVVAPPDLR